MATAGLVIAGVIGIIVLAAAITVLVVVNKVKRVVDTLGITKDDISDMEYEMETTPKSVNAMTSVYLPRIERDFPDFNYYEFRTKAENMMISAFRAIENADISHLYSASADLNEQIKSRISYNTDNHFRETFRDIKLHRTEIKNYRKEAGTCIITLQSSVGYVHCVKDSSGSVIKGDDERTFQTRYDTELLYIQDVSKTEKGETLISNTCPNCGAPIKGIGNKSCPYCGSAVQDINIRAWSINKLTEC